jgi:hypothetical protein
MGPAVRAAHMAASLETRRRIEVVIEHVLARVKSADLPQLRALTGWNAWRKTRSVKTHRFAISNRLTGVWPGVSLA